MMNSGTIRVVDLDSTVSDDKWRQWLIDPQAEDGENKYHAYHIHCDRDSAINRHIVDESPVPVFFVTARPEYVRQKITNWLREKNFKYQALIMRPNGNHQHSVDLKRKLISDLLMMFEIERAYDDRADIIEMCKELGLRGILV